MPQYEDSANNVMIQYFPGEVGAAHGLGSSGGNGLKGPIDIPGSYYSHPEEYGYELDQSPWTYTEERRASIALYDYRGMDDAAEWALLDGEQRVVVAPRSWRTIQVFDKQEAGAAPAEPSKPFLVVVPGLLGVSHAAINRSANF